MAFPAAWPSPIAIAQPYAPGASSTPSDKRSTCAIGIAPASSAAAAMSGALSRIPKKFGCWKITAAASAAASRTRSGSVAPPSCGTSTISRPKPGA
jgi:hypothetical protein